MERTEQIKITGPSTGFEPDWGFDYYRAPPPDFLGDFFRDIDYGPVLYDPTRWEDFDEKEPKH